MYNIYNSLFLNDGEGVQDFKIFYDTLFLNAKVVNNLEFLNVLLIEPLKYDFASADFSSGGEGVLINFGDTLNSSPLLSNGNTLVDCILDDNSKTVFIVGLSSTSNYTIPIIYSYDLNKKSLLKAFPSEESVSNWAGFTNFTYDPTQVPLIKKTDNLSIGFKTLSAGQYYLNIIDFVTNKNECIIKDYNMIEIPNLHFTGFNDTGVVYKMGGDYGTLDYK